MKKVVVVGAGMSGLTAASRLVEAGWSVMVVDKARAVGGRMASRRIGTARFDHGAQHISARHPEFRDAMDRWIDAGVAEVWFESPSRTRDDRATEARHCGTGGMREIPEYLARGLEVRTATPVSRIDRTGAMLSVIVPNARIEADAMIITAPLPQTIALLEASSIPAPTTPDLATVEYDPCLTVMATLDGPSGLVDGHRATDGDAAWIADNHHKGVSATHAITIQSSPEFARLHLDTDPSIWCPLLVASANAHIDAQIVQATTHRWRYSMPRSTLDIGALAASDDPPVLLAGEVFAGARVEGAFLSGVAAARMLMALTGAR